MKALLTFLACIPVIANAQFGQIENGGLENWQSVLIADLPDQWNTDNEAGVNKVIQSNDARSGMYSLRLESYISSDGDTLPSSVFLGTVSSDLRGIPYTSAFQAVGGYYKCNVAPGDTATIVVAKFFAGIPTFSIVPFTGTESNWTYFSLPVSTGPVDSLFFGISSGSPATTGDASLGSWIMMDSVHVLHSGGSHPANLPNYDFENWTSVEAEDPNKFSTLNVPLYSLDLPGVEKTSDASSGSFAAKLTTRAGYGNLRSYLSIGDIDLNQGGFIQYFDYHATPLSIDGMYKTSGGSLDTAYLYTEFVIGGISHPQIHSFPPTTSYTSFSFPLNLPIGSGSPDSAMVVFFTGPQIGSSLYLDELAFEGGDVSLNEELPLRFTTYPNPAVDVLRIASDQIEKGELVISTLDGKSVYSQNVIFDGTSQAEIDVSTLENGIYIVTIKADDLTYSQQVIVQR